LLAREVPLTPERLKAVALVQDVPLPVQVTAILFEWCAGSVVGAQVKLAAAGEN